jgi:hypothetical protein
MDIICDKETYKYCRVTQRLAYLKQNKKYFVFTKFGMDISHYF